MGLPPLGTRLSLPALVGEKLKLKPGETVTVNILKPLAPGKWAVGIRGSVFPARSSVDLTAGDVLKALISVEQGRIVLRLVSEEQTVLARALLAEGLPADELTLLIVGTLVKNSLKIDEQVILRIKSLLGELKGDSKRLSRLMGLVLSKGISLSGNGIKALIELLDFGGREEQRREKKKKREHPPLSVTTAEVMDAFSEAIESMLARPASSLAVFNHLHRPDSDGQWIVLPFNLDREAFSVHGTLRLKIDPGSGRMQTLVLSVADGGEKRLSFLLIPLGTGYRLTVYSNHAHLIGTRLSTFHEQVERLHTLGVQCHEMVESDVTFDGFEPDEEDFGYRHVDMEG
ncbi:MAG TPA: hypothetical protein ENN69_01300 [Spirochaetia bacterium]|nr:hypothetical protein [Spirochaetia bacterium]